MVVVGAVLILAPHVIGAPQLSGEHASGVPAHLATAFAANALGVAQSSVSARVPWLSTNSRPSPSPPFAARAPASPGPGFPAGTVTLRGGS